MSLYTCRICKKENFLRDEMRWNNGSLNQCKKCWNEYQRNLIAKKKLDGTFKTPPQQLRIKRYGITKEQYNKLVELHLGGCAICKQPPSKKFRLSVDHDHKTGKVRGLLCNFCNSALGQVKEDEDILSGMIEYLKNDGVLTGINY